MFYNIQLKFRLFRIYTNYTLLLYIYDCEEIVKNY